MSLPSFPSSGSPSSHVPPYNRPSASPIFDYVAIPGSRGAGTLLPKPLLIVCGVCTIIATAVSIFSITLQLKSYRRPHLQRFVVRIMLMVPLYAIASLIAIFSLDAAFFIDAIRDLYEAFVIYAFLQLLITYLGGERSLLILLHGRPPIPHPFPVNLFLAPMDVSDPWVLLNLKRGVLQYVQIKPLLVLATIILKATDTYREGALRWDAGYTYVSVIYNASICLSLYCLAMFWVCVSSDLKPFRPVPKFLCVKGILFFSFWQSIGISLLVAFGAIKRLGVYTDPEHMSLALTDALVCLEMPFFAIAHQYAFQASDYIDHSLQYSARMPFYYALRDAFGLKDVWEDVKATFRGRGISYQAYEPAEGGLHYGDGRQRRIRAGLRYSKGGKQKYWIPTPGDEARTRGETGLLTSVKRKMEERRAAREGYAPLLPNQAARVISTDPTADWSGFSSDSDDSDAPSLTFDRQGKEDKWEEATYKRARKIEYVGYPNVDVSKEEARRAMWEDEQGVLAGKWQRGQRGSGSRPISEASKARRERAASKGKKAPRENGRYGVYGAWANRVTSPSKSTATSTTATSPSGANNTSANLADVVLHAATPDTETEAWLYDGDNERETWRPSSSKSKGKLTAEEEQQLRWTKRRRDGAKSPLSGVTSPFSDAGSEQRSGADGYLHPSGSIRGHHIEDTAPANPFELGTADDDDDPSPDSPVHPSDRPLPSDAVDLMVDDHEAVQEIIQNEIKRGEPATHAPKHVYRPGWEVKGDQGGSDRWKENGAEVAVYENEEGKHGPDEAERKQHDERQEVRLEGIKAEDGGGRPSLQPATLSSDGKKTKLTDPPPMHAKIFGEDLGLTAGKTGEHEVAHENPWQ